MSSRMPPVLARVSRPLTSALDVLPPVRWWRSLPEAEIGRFPHGMEYARWGDGPRTLLWLPGGPGSDVPRGTFARLSAAQFRPLLDAGFSVWSPTRRRNMPAGHTVADMADDVAVLIDEQFGGRVDAVVGLSYGGMLAQFLAARHPARVGRVVVALCAVRVSEWGRDVDRRWAEARAAGRDEEAAVVMAEYVWPGENRARLRRRVGPLMTRMMGLEKVPASDLLIEAEAEIAFDARDILPQIRVPLLLIAADEDLFFTREIVEETVGLIPDCTLVRYAGKGHLRAATSHQLTLDVLRFVDAPAPEGQ